MPQANLRSPVDRDVHPSEDAPPAGVPGGVGARLRAALGGVGAVDVVFWGLLVLLLALLVAPLWVGPMPPLTDFGGHVQMADAWVRVPTDPFIAGLVERHDSWLVPNLLAVRFAAALHPLLDVVAGLRLFVTLCMVGLVGGVLWVLREWGRSRWLVFLALPFTWNGMLALGLINYAAAMVLMFFVVALGHRYGRRGRTRDAVALAVALVVAFWAHGLGAPITMLMALFVLVVSAARPRRLLGLLALAPSVALWVQWYLRTRKALGIGHETQTSFSMKKNWDELLVNTIDVHVDGGDMAVLAALVGAWIILLATSRRRDAELASVPSLASWRSAPVAAARSLGARVWREARDNALLLLAVGLLFGYFFVAPAYIGTTFISPRLIVPAILLLFMVPRVPERGLLPKLAIGAAVLASFLFARDIGRHVRAFEHEELEPVAQLAERIPPDSRVLCAEVFRVDPIFIRAPLDHNCNGVLVARSGGFADGAFADTPYNAVVLRDRGDKVKLRSNKWQTFPALSRLDYVVVRGDHRAPAPDVAAVVETVEPEVWELGPKWTLYEVQHPERVDTTYEDACGGKGGAPLLWNCPRGMALSGIIATTTPDGKLLGSVQARCRALEVRSDGVVHYAGRRETGPRFGEAVQHHRRVIECPGGQVLVGLSGTSSNYVNHLSILCGEGRLVPTEANASVEELKFAETGEERGMVGGEAGAPFALVCPDDSVPIGLRGGFGYMIDSVGIACADARQVMADAAARQEPPPTPSHTRGRTPAKHGDAHGDRSPSAAREHARKASKPGPKRPAASGHGAVKARPRPATEKPGPLVGPPAPGEAPRHMMPSNLGPRPPATLHRPDVKLAPAPKEPSRRER